MHFLERPMALVRGLVALRPPPPHKAYNLCCLGKGPALTGALVWFTMCVLSLSLSCCPFLILKPLSFGRIAAEQSSRLAKYRTLR